jgi:ribonuclease BN (tRNA processing enzyme)
MYVDPGPGVLVRAKQYGVKLNKINSIFVSHAHPDHCNDLEMVVEAMTYGVREKKGILISNKNVIKGSEEFRPYISKYHLGVLESYHIAKPNEEFNFLNVKLKTTKCKHDEPECIGFVLEDKKKIGYTADTEYYDGLENYFKGCDCLIINCLRPRNSEPYGHMTSDKAKILVEKVKPKLAILQHFGMKLLFGVAEREAKWIEKETGVKTVAARDGKSYEIIEKESLKEF